MAGPEKITVFVRDCQISVNQWTNTAAYNTYACDNCVYLKVFFKRTEATDSKSTDTSYECGCKEQPEDRPNDPRPANSSNRESPESWGIEMNTWLAFFRALNSLPKCPQKLCRNYEANLGGSQNARRTVWGWGILICQSCQADLVRWLYWLRA